MANFLERMRGGGKENSEAKSREDLASEEKRAEDLRTELTSRKNYLNEVLMNQDATSPRHSADEIEGLKSERRRTEDLLRESEGRVSELRKKLGIEKTGGEA